MSAGARFITALRAAIGTPYQWGGATKAGFDCSGLVYWAAKIAGIHGVPRTTYQQIDVGQPIGLKQLRPGDLVFSDFEGTGKPTHVVVYIGNGKVIAAPHTGTDVQVQPMSNFLGHIVGARRILAHPNGAVVQATRYGVPAGGGGQNPAAALAALAAIPRPALPQFQAPRAGQQLAQQIALQPQQRDPSQFIQPAPSLQPLQPLGQSPTGPAPVAFQAQSSLDALHRKLLTT